MLTRTTVSSNCWTIVFPKRMVVSLEVEVVAVVVVVEMVEMAAVGAAAAAAVAQF